VKTRLIAIVLALLVTPVWLKVTKKSRMKKYLAAPSRFAEINRARAEGKPLLFSVVLPGCPWASHAAEQVAQMQERLGDRYVFLQVGSSVETSGTEPFNVMTESCHRGLCLFDPSRGKVEELEETTSVDELAARMERFAGG
jgi:hypothetical protein